jgi:hypothetical protein
MFIHYSVVSLNDNAYESQNQKNALHARYPVLSLQLRPVETLYLTSGDNTEITNATKDILKSILKNHVKSWYKH